jgi:hypothetical protein
MTGPAGRPRRRVLRATTRRPRCKKLWTPSFERIKYRCNFTEGLPAGRAEVLFSAAASEPRRASIR